MTAVNGLRNLCFAFVIMSLSASFVYILNDIGDVENDRYDLSKRVRPIAAGEVSVFEARVLGCVFLVLIGAVLFITHNILVFLPMPLIYILLNILYTFRVKKIPLLDVFVLMFCYLIRLKYGGDVVGCEISAWVFLTMMSFALLMGFGKRRGEMQKKIHAETVARKSIKGDETAFFDKCMTITAASAIIFYSLACADTHTTVAMSGKNLLWTVPVVFFLMLRYLMLIEKGVADGDPVPVILSDWILWVIGGVFVAMVAIELYCPFFDWLKNRIV